ncbi:hypothetical protein KKY_954 [Pelagibacterium halotolerans B2]|uniref:Uncharacterized protein n=1 Tax=Pelagibacterium halotolerans (strain DSM 22347 / JCM 15775 / CGMCC 1.7692 / B2) TaxID=1082931 RepID=G4RFU7_PELHB|nr:hypothetical protein KKY_954 [Pelagibacterium halotolerans B2]
MVREEIPLCLYLWQQGQKVIPQSWKAANVLDEIAKRLGMLPCHVSVKVLFVLVLIKLLTLTTG